MTDVMPSLEEGWGTGLMPFGCGNLEGGLAGMYGQPIDPEPVFMRNTMRARRKAQNTLGPRIR